MAKKKSKKAAAASASDDEQSDHGHSHSHGHGHDHDHDDDHDDDHDAAAPVKTARQRRQEELDRLAAEVRKAKGYHEGHGHSHGGTNDHKKKKKAGKREPYNWSAIVIMALMIIPAAVSLALSAYDSYFPEQAAERRIHNALLNCYEAVDPSKIDNIPNLLRKYKGRERKLFTKLMDKYPEDPECHIMVGSPDH